MIGDDIEVTILGVADNKVRIGIQAPREIPVYRQEVWEEIRSGKSGPGDRAVVDEGLEALAQGAAEPAR
jgi:carbon storage regulator